MQLNILSKLREILTENQINELNEFLEFHNGGYITSGDVSNRLDISFEDAKNVTKELFRYNYTDMKFKIYCNNEIDMCETETFDSIEDIPNEKCEKCEKGCSILPNIIIIYKVLKSDLYE